MGSREREVKKIHWIIILIIFAITVLLWMQTLNSMCDQDVQFFTGICTVNKFIPW